MDFDHFSIRTLSEKDLEPYFNLIENNRPRLETFFAGIVAKTKTFADTAKFLTEIIKKKEERIYLPFVIQDTENNSFAGFLDIKNIDWNIPKAELGLFIDKEYEGRGISTKAFNIFVKYCFTSLGFNKLFLRTHQTNLAAQKLAENAGFQKEGLIRRDYKTTDGDLVDLIYYGKLP